ncbi:ankyrin repeat domain-containing protein [Microbacterium murale]|uniref:Ankyrin repeat protein n=1 Tax=Microbacterium murale TaxID=1081040 RepID=A0ABU0P9M8_9MICO|nr:ankyrin repeat domain-containing protein [Microbacterium murale]MDQ0643642.1 ankyrin repeat protein [Microbacterium murale]
MRDPFRRRTLAVLSLAASLSLLAACAPAPHTAPSTQPSTPSTQKALDEQLRDAAWADDIGQAAELIRSGADVNAKDSTQQSAYLIATSEGYLDLLHLTIKSGAAIDDKDNWNGTGLIRAAERGHGLVTGALIQEGIDLDHVNRIGYQAIHEAVWFGQDDPEYATTVRTLIAAGAELDRVSESERLTALQMADQRGFVGLHSILETASKAEPMADPDAELLAAAQSGDADAAAIALRAGADLETRDPDLQQTPLMRAVLADRVSVAQLLIAMGADPDAFDYRQDTPWVMTGVTGSVPMLEALLPGGPDLSIPNRRGGTPAHPAAERGHAEYIARVTQLDIDVNRVNLNGWTALLEAVVFGDGGPAHQEIVRTLLENGADADIRDANGISALEHARDRGYTEIVALLGG